MISGVGFCMGFSRHAVDRIGFADTQAFGRGYAEENDCVLRARRAGYRNLLIPNLYVHHEHGASYSSAEKRHLVARNLRIVETRYPGYHDEVQKYFVIDPARRLRDGIALHIACAESKDGAVLVIDHKLGGGANYYREGKISQWQKSGRPVISALIERHSNRMEIVGAAAGRLVSFPDTTIGELVDALPLLNVKEILFNPIVSSANPLEILDALTKIKKATGAKVVFAAHDFYPVCPSYNLLDQNGRYCGLPSSLKPCHKCLALNKGEVQQYIAPVGSQKTWRRKWNRFFVDDCDVLECYSQSTAELFARAYPHAAMKIILNPHKVEYLSEPVPVNLADPLHVEVVGAISYAKGAEIVRALSLHMAKRNDKSKLTVIGTIDARLSSEVAQVTGAYVRQYLPKIITSTGANMFLFRRFGQRLFHT